MSAGGCVCTEWMSQALAGHQFTANQFSPACSLRCQLGGEKGVCRRDRAEGRASLHQPALRTGLQPRMGRQEKGTARDEEGQREERCWHESSATELQEKSVVRKEQVLLTASQQGEIHGKGRKGTQNMPSLEDLAGV